MMHLLSRHRTPSVTPGQAAADASLLLVDVRGPDEFRAGHAPAAQNIPLDRLEAQVGELAASGRQIAFICRSGTRSTMAVRAARRAGIEASNVTGGMLAWQKAGLPVETGSRSAKRRR